MDADDLMFPNRLQVQMEVIKQRPDLVLVGTASSLLTPFGHIFERVLSPPPQSREVDTNSLGWGRFLPTRRRSLGGLSPWQWVASTLSSPWAMSPCGSACSRGGKVGRLPNPCTWVACSHIP